VILHPGILALLGGSSVVLFLMVNAALLGIIILRRWDLDSSSAYQLTLERKTYLISTLMNYVLGFQIVSAFLFIYTVDDIHKLFVGAMCATGSLNANPVGWYALGSKIAVFFLAGLWIAINYVDQRVEDYPLVRLKYSLLIILTPLIAFDLFLQLQYFLGLDPDIITSCCGSLFSAAGTAVASTMATLPVRLTMAFFYAAVLLFLVVSLACLYSPRAFWRYVHSALAALFFVMALAAVVSFVSIYIYELPTHHCPFDILQEQYGFIGYPLYLSLFGSVFFGLLPGLLQALKRTASLRKTIDSVERPLVILSLGCLLIFVVLVTCRIVFSNLTLSP
jgi:hypothetical protein